MNKSINTTKNIPVVSRHHCVSVRLRRISTCGVIGPGPTAGLSPGYLTDGRLRYGAVHCFHAVDEGRAPPEPVAPSVTSSIRLAELHCGLFPAAGEGDLGVSTAPCWV